MKERLGSASHRIYFCLPLCGDISMKEACDSDLYSNQNLFLLKCSVLQDKGELSWSVKERMFAESTLLDILSPLK